MGTGCGNLWNDLFLEIVSRLPVKSLLRFKCCCKFVSSLVEDIDFIATHIKNYNDDNTRLIVNCHTEKDFDLIHVPILYLDETLSDLSYQHLYTQVLTEEIILGCHGGLIFLFNLHKIKLLNLATRSSRIISISKIRLPTYLTTINYHVGFGLDPISKDWKLVTISDLCDSRSIFGSSPFSHVAIYNFNTNIWREFGDNGLIHYKVSSQCTYLDGICYWLMYQEEADGVIQAFDLNVEKFNQIEIPISVQQLEYMTIGLYHGHLSLIISENTYRSSFGVWVMNERLWTKQLTITLVLKGYSPIGFWKNDGVFFRQQDSWQLFLYDFSTKEVRELRLEDNYIEICTFSYKESLFPVVLQGCE